MNYVRDPILMRWLIAMVRMSRPLQLGAVSLVYLSGGVLAVHRGAEVSVVRFFWGYLTLLIGAISIHLANEYADFETDLKTTRTMFSGGSGALVEMKLERSGALVLAWISLVLTVLFTVSSLIAQRMESLSAAILALGVFWGWMYSMSPLKVAWRGWGEVLNASLGGLLLPLYGSTVLSGRVDFSVLVVMLPFALLTFNNLLATTYADRISDHLVGKFTLATRLSNMQLRSLYGSVSILALLALLVIPAYLMPDSVKLISILAIPVMIWGWGTYTRKHDPLASVSAMTVMLILQVCGFLIFGNMPGKF